MATTARGRVRAPRVAPAVGRRRTGPVVALGARLLAGRLDRELAAGAAPWQGSLHVARALQLTADGHRIGLARSLERLLARSAAPGPADHLGLVVAVPSEPLLAAEPALRALIRRLRDGEPVDVRGVAGISELLADGCGPLYDPRSPVDLDAALTGILTHLDVPA